MIDPLHVQSKKVGKKKKRMETQGGKKKKKEVYVQHFESGHGALHEHQH